MGKWMESIDSKGNIINEITPNYIIYCSKYLPKDIRSEFPIISKLDLHSTYWIDEIQHLGSEKVTELYSEFKRLRRITKMEEFIKETVKQSLELKIYL